MWPLASWTTLPYIVHIANVSNSDSLLWLQIVDLVASTLLIGIRKCIRPVKNHTAAMCNLQRFPRAELWGTRHNPLWANWVWINRTFKERQAGVCLCAVYPVEMVRWLSMAWISVTSQCPWCLMDNCQSMKNMYTGCCLMSRIISLQSKSVESYCRFWLITGFCQAGQMTDSSIQKASLKWNSGVWLKSVHLAAGSSSWCRP